MACYRIFAEEYLHDHVMVNAWLQSFEPEANEGRGAIHFTLDASEAMEFASVEAATAFINTVPESRPMRDDGEPNRPLTGFTVTVEQIGSDSP